VKIPTRKSGKLMNFQFATLPDLFETLGVPKYEGHLIIAVVTPKPEEVITEIGEYFTSVRKYARTAVDIYGNKWRFLKESDTENSDRHIHQQLLNMQVSSTFFINCVNTDWNTKVCAMSRVRTPATLRGFPLVNIHYDEDCKCYTSNFLSCGYVIKGSE